MSRRMRMVRSVSAFAVAAGLAASTTLAASPAGAAGQQSTPLTVTGSDTRTQSFEVTLTRTADAPAQRGQAAQEVITCGGTVTAPVQSGSDIRVDVQASCDGIVDTIEVGVGIGINGVLGPDDGRTVGPANYNSHFVTTPCPGTAKTYQGAAFAVFTKAGYANSPLTLAGSSPRVTITC